MPFPLELKARVSLPLQQEQGKAFYLLRGETESAVFGKTGLPFREFADPEKLNPLMNTVLDRSSFAEKIVNQET